MIEESRLPHGSPFIHLVHNLAHMMLKATHPPSEGGLISDANKQMDMIRHENILSYPCTVIHSRPGIATKRLMNGISCQYALPVQGAKGYKVQWLSLRDKRESRRF